METQFHKQTTAHNTIYLLQQMLKVSNQSTAISNSLVERAKMVRSISVAKGIPIPELGINPLFAGVKIVTNTTPNWAIYNISQDPLWHSGNFPVPRNDLRRLNQLYLGGIEFDAMYVAHELPIGFDHENDSLELSLIEPAPPMQAIGLAQKIGLATDGIVAMYAAASRKPFQALAMVGNKGSTILRDPILMGTIVPPRFNPEEGVPAVWFLLAAWRW